MKLRMLIPGVVGTVLMIGCAGVSSSEHTSVSSSVHSVDLSWVASTSANVSGYNVYRAPYAGSCGSFDKLNSVLITNRSYRDNDVTDGASYCYATTAVSSSRQESAFSEIVLNVQVPKS